MDYSLSVEVFKKNMFVEDGTKIKHSPGKTFKLLPFAANNNIPAVLNLDHVLGRYICKIRGEEPIAITSEELFGRIAEETEIEPGQEDVFYEMLRQLFFQKDGEIRPLNLELICRTPCLDNSELKLADYLIDVLGEKSILKDILADKKTMLSGNNNVLEQLVISKMEMREVQDVSGLEYFPVTRSLFRCFESDFSFILDSTSFIKEYLTQLLEFYYFSYTAQVCLQLDRFLNGDRQTVIPLYFCLDWEKTSQSRKSYSEGWKKLAESVEHIFAHAIVLEILNQTESGSAPLDYIALKEMIEQNADSDAAIAEQISKITSAYREAITDCSEMTELKREKTPLGLSADEIRYLYKSVRIQFELKRKRPYDAYAEKYKAFCEKYLKNRGRIGKMLNLTEEMLIFLTKIVIKDRDQLRLKEVFQGFESRGVFLDDTSKEKVAAYFEKLNLIEKKSDSGDAKYVKRIL